MGPWTLAWICCPQLPHHPYKNGTAQHKFVQHIGGTRRPSHLVPSTFFKQFSRGEGLSLVRSQRTPWEALYSKLWGWYQVPFLGLIFGHSWSIGEGPMWHLGTVPLRNPKALKPEGTSRKACLENPEEGFQIPDPLSACH